MACNNPNKVFYIGIDKDTGKRKIAFAGRDTTYVVPTPNGYSQHVGEVPPGVDGYTDCDLVPCGQCLGCRLDRARSWAVRCMLEKKYYPDDECWFVTCSYDDDNLPKYYRVPERWITHKKKDENGDPLPPTFVPAHNIFTSEPGSDYELLPDPGSIDVNGKFHKQLFASLSKRDHQIFMKNLRKKSDSKLRFFMCGEYGDLSKRCHLHYIVFGLKVPDLKFYKINFEGDPMYNSEFIDEAWNHKGFCVLSKVTFNTCNYVARYITKKQLGKSRDIYEKLNIEPEFTCMSLKPGIGYQYFLDHKDELYKYDSISMPSKDGAFSTRLPRFYDLQFEKLDPLFIAELKERRSDMAECTESAILERYPHYDRDRVYSIREDKLKNNTIRLMKGEF